MSNDNIDEKKYAFRGLKNAKQNITDSVAWFDGIDPEIKKELHDMTVRLDELASEIYNG